MKKPPGFPSFVASIAATLVALVPLAPGVLGAQAKQQGRVADNSASVSAVRAALDKYKDPIAAVRDGYYSTVGCVDFPTGSTEHGSMEYKPGAMGVHFINMALVGPSSIRQNAGPSLRTGRRQARTHRRRVVRADGTLQDTSDHSWPPVDGPMEGHAPIMRLDFITGTCTSGSGRPIPTACTARRTPR